MSSDANAAYSGTLFGSRANLQTDRLQLIGRRILDLYEGGPAALLKIAERGLGSVSGAGAGGKRRKEQQACKERGCF
jgi:hypothetical protein